MGIELFCTSLQGVSKYVQKYFPVRGGHYNTLYFDIFGVNPGRTLDFEDFSNPVRNGIKTVDGLTRFFETIGPGCIPRKRTPLIFDRLLGWLGWYRKSAHVNVPEATQPRPVQVGLVVAVQDIAEFDLFLRSLKNLYKQLERIFPHQNTGFVGLYFSMFSTQPNKNIAPKGWDSESSAVRSGTATLNGVNDFLDSVRVKKTA